MADGESGGQPGGNSGGRGLLTRRTLLVAGAAGLATAGIGVGAASGVVDLVAGASPEPQVRVERVRSAARGRDVDMVTILPSQLPARNLPVCLFLHGLHGKATQAAPTGLAKTLVARAADGTLPPFAFVALDGGDNYWHENHVGDNPMGMLLDEVPTWLRARGLGDATGTPFACAGVSMGGFGALLYARRRQERATPVNAVAAISPGLLMSWREMSTRRAFKSNTEWASLDPLRNVEKIDKSPVGIWCGTEDHFIEGARKFMRLAKPEVSFTGPGGHGDSFYRKVVPDVLSFLGKHAPTTSAKA